MLTPAELNEFRQEINKINGKSVEEWLSNRWNEIQNIKSSSKKNSEINLFGHILMYVWNIMRIVSNTYTDDSVYKSFLKNLYDTKDEDFGIVNFNYDTLLDRAFEQIFHKTFTSIEHYLDENFIKPHGSVNWLLEKRENDPNVPTNNDISLRINMAMRQFFTNGSIPLANLRVLSPTLEHLRYADIAQVWSGLGMEYFYPLIFLPMAQKKLDHFTDFYEKVMKKAEGMFAEAEEIYVIGYRAKDDIIKNLFKFIPQGTTLHVISHGEADKISRYIQGFAIGLKQGSLISGGFAEFNKLHFRKPGEF